jgi:PAS domain S-box-containing protein
MQRSTSALICSTTCAPLQSDWLFGKLREFCRIEYVIVDLNLSIVEHSPHAQEFGNPPDAIQVSRNLCEGFPELVGCETILQNLSNQQDQRFELRAATRVSATSKLTYFDFYITQLDEMTHHIVVFLIDVTQQMQLEQSLVQGANEATYLSQNLAASRSYISNILFSMPCALVVVTQSNQIKNLNLYSESLFGYCECELLNKSATIILPDSKSFLSEDAAISTSDKFLKNVVTIGQTKTGERIALSVSISIISDGQIASPEFALVVQKLD